MDTRLDPTTDLPYLEGFNGYINLGYHRKTDLSTFRARFQNGFIYNNREYYGLQGNFHDATRSRFFRFDFERETHNAIWKGRIESQESVLGKTLS